MPRRPQAMRPVVAAPPGGFVFGVNFDTTARTPDPEDVYITAYQVGRIIYGPNALGFSLEMQTFSSNSYNPDGQAASIPDQRIKGYLLSGGSQSFYPYLPVNVGGYRFWCGQGYSGGGGQQRLVITSQVNGGGTTLLDTTSVSMSNQWRHADNTVWDRAGWSANYASSFVDLPSPDDAGVDSGYTLNCLIVSGLTFVNHWRFEQL